MKLNPNFPTPADIRAWVGEAAYQRGQHYVRAGRVRHPRRQGPVLKALCVGQAIEPYRVQVRLGEDEILDARCTCPAGRDGRCKHVAAVLILWHQHPQAFQTPPPLSTLLAQWEKAALLDLIEAMIARYPDLADFVWLKMSSAPPKGLSEEDITSPGAPPRPPTP
ncbi:MAG: hypothetical protein GXO56_03105 [Chloroflexi bacterium]|nr:hypothetical protein [Chloroflexota bacterium]